MNPNYPNQDPQYPPRTHAQNASPVLSPGAHTAYGFDGLIPLQQQQHQAYLNNLNAPVMYQQHQLQQPQQHYSPSYYNAPPQTQYYPNTQAYHHFPMHQQPQHPTYPPQYHPGFTQGPPQHIHAQQFIPGRGNNVQQHGSPSHQPNDTTSMHSRQPQQQNQIRQSPQSQAQHTQPQPQPTSILPPQQAPLAKTKETQPSPQSPHPSSLDGGGDYPSKPVHFQKSKGQQDQPQSKARSQPQARNGIYKTNETKNDAHVDQRLLLLSLADQYVSQARLAAHQVASNADGPSTQQYYKLIATGLACYETVLKTPSWHSSPRQEALVRLRYATLLHEETENDRIVEETLAKGIALCERNRLTSVKYSMQHLLTRAIFVTKPKAALKALDNALEEAKASRHVAWIYAFNILRASLIIHQSPPNELRYALSSLQAVSELAKSQRDAAVCAVANVMEAMLHMRLKQPNWHEEFSRALATARAQLMSLADGVAATQINAQVHIIDLASALELCQPKLAEQKRKALMAYFDGIQKAPWPSDGTVLLPIKGTVSDTLTADTCGIFVTDAAGKTQLRLCWLDKMATWALGYTFNGIVNLSRPQHEQADCEGLFKEALKCAERSLSGEGMPRSLEWASLQIHARQKLRCYILLNLTFLYCNRYDLAGAAATLDKLKALLTVPGVTPSANILDLATYLDAIIMHAQGRSDEALRAYQSPRLVLEPGNFSGTTLQRNLSILAALSVILIIRAPSHPSHHTLRPLLELVSPIFAGVKSTADAHERQLNPQLAAAYSLVLAVAHEDRWTGGSVHDNETSVLSTKKHLQTCFHVAKDMHNHLLLTAGLSFLHTQLFHGQVGDQALKSAQSAQEMAKSAGSPLWSSVSDGIAAQAYEKSGLVVEAQRAREHGETMAERLPQGVLEVLERSV